MVDIKYNIPSFNPDPISSPDSMFDSTTPYTLHIEI